MAHAGATFDDLPSEILHVLAKLSWPYLRGVNKASHKEWEAVKAIMEEEVRALRDLIDEELKFRDANPDWLHDLNTATSRRLYELTHDQLRAIYDKVSVPRLREAEGYLYTTRADRLEQMDYTYTDFVEVIERIGVSPGPHTRAARDAYFASIPDVDREKTMERRVEELVDILCAALVADDTEANGGVPTINLANVLSDIFDRHKHMIMCRLYSHPSFNREMP
eukprot:jgi/Mesvir1/2496/Mv25505-RA.1